MPDLNKIPEWVADFYKFATECLGYSKNEAMGWSELTKEHKDLCRFMQVDKHMSKMVLMPRYSLKSCLVTAAYSLWRMLHNPNIRILIYSDTSTKAVGFLSEIKNHIEGNSGVSKFREYWDWKPERNKGAWTDGMIEIKGRTVASKEPTVDTGGIETSKVGAHYDLIIFDDIVSDLNITTKMQMDKVFDCYRKSLSLLKPGGSVVMVGTRWSFGDCYGRLIQESYETKEWGFFFKKAEVKGTYPFESIGLTKDFLSGQKQKLGSFLYSALYQNNPVDDTTALFKHDDFTFYARGMSSSGLFVTCTCDPAGEGEDYTGVTVVGTDKGMRMFLLYAKAEHWRPNQIIDELIRLSYGYKYVKLGLEGKIFQGMLEGELNRRLGEERKNPDFTPFSLEIFDATCKKGEGKSARISSLQPYHERHCLLFPGDSVERLSGDYAELSSQMLQWTQTHKPVHDDLLDSLSYHVQLVRPGTEEKEEDVSEYSIMGIINKEVEGYNRLQRRLPRKYWNLFQPVF